MSRVTVIIPTYNRASLLPRAIRSVLAQTHRPIELLIVDDGSTDETEAVVGALGEPTIRYIRHARNQGQCAAINTGILAAQGDFVSFLDSDDEWLPDMIEKQIAVFARSDERVGVVYTGAGARLPDGGLAPSHVSHLQGQIYREALTQGYVAHSVAMLVRRRCFDTIGLFDTAFVCFQDDDICFRLAKEYGFGLVPETLAVVHIGAGDQLTKDRRSYARGWLNLLEKHEAEILRECGRGTLAGHYFRAGLLFLDAGERKPALSAFRRAFHLRPSVAPLAGIAVSLLPYPDVSLRVIRSRPLKGWRAREKPLEAGSR